MTAMDMPLLGYGTWPLQGDQAIACTQRALELGYRHLDTAQMYGNETEVGRAMLGSRFHRDEVFLTTKVHPDNYVDTRFADSVRRSLDQLAVDQVDLLLLHWPHRSLVMEAVLDHLLVALEGGQARRIGVSNFNPDDLARAQAHTEGRIFCNQIELHPFVDQRPTIEAANRLGIKLVAYCPVARGKVLDDPTLQTIAAAHGITPAQVALAWLIQQGIAAIPMSRNRERAEANLASQLIKLDSEEIGQIDGMAQAGGKLIMPSSLTSAWGLPPASP